MSVLVIVLVVSALALVGLAFVMGRQGSADVKAHAATKTSDAVAVGGQSGPPVFEKLNWLVGVGGDVKGKAFLVGQRRISIGRSPANFIQVVDNEASRMHCHLEPGDGFLTIVDMKSHNGTHINGQKVQRGELHPGDVLEIGDARLQFVLRGDFDQDDVLAGKQADAAKFSSTVTANGESLVGVIKDALRENGGDYHKAAAQLGIDIDVLRHLVASSGLEVRLPDP